MDILLQLVIFIAATFVIIKSADLLVDNGEKLGKSLHVPYFVIGVLVMAIGTSLPELATGVSATLKGETDLVLANVLGSNIANVFLGLGFIAFITRKHIDFKQNVFEVHFPILMMALMTLVVTIYDKVITPVEGVIFILILSAYIWFLFSRDQITHQKREDAIPFSWKYPLLIGGGLVGLVFSADFLVSSVLELAGMLGIAKSALAASLIAIGTSLPELAVGMSAVKKGNTEMLVGNILGSNIFNILLIIPIASFIAPLEASDQTFNLMLPFLIGSTFIYWVSKKDQKITVQEGAAMTVLYILFLGKLFAFI